MFRSSTWPPVRIAKSCMLAFLLSPNPGALIAQTFSSVIKTFQLVYPLLPLNFNTKYPQGTKNINITFIPARNLFKIRVANASLSTSSATISKGLCLCDQNRKHSVMLMQRCSDYTQSQNSPKQDRLPSVPTPRLLPQHLNLRFSSRELKLVDLPIPEKQNDREIYNAEQDVQNLRRSQTKFLHISGFSGW